MCATSLLLAVLTAASLPYAAEAGRLGEDSFRRREEASARLLSSLPASLPAVMLAGLSDDVEVRHRANLILSHWRGVLWRPVAAGWDGRKFPWIDQLPPDFPDRKAIKDKYLARVQAGAWYEFTGDYLAYRDATRLWMSDRIWAGATPGECLALLDKMSQWEALGNNWHEKVRDAECKAAPLPMAYAE